MTDRECLKRFETGVCHPEVSGFEVLELLDARSALARLEDRLTDHERQRVEAADRMFLANASAFYESVRQVADLDVQRRQSERPPSHWWWYLDELAELSDREPTASTPR